jgi:manganese transport system substrate-binding protein
MAAFRSAGGSAAGGSDSVGVGAFPCSSPRPPVPFRRIVPFALLVLLLGCTARRPEAEAVDSRPRVLASFTVLADMAEQVACGRLRVESLTRPGAEIHGYEVTPSDLRRARGAQLLLENGLGLERWLDRFATSLGPIPRVTLSRGVETIPIEAEGGRATNPHAWMSPKAARIYVANLREAFTRLDPAGANDYRRCAEAYGAQLDRLDRELRQEIAALPPERRLLVTCEGAFSYLARDYGLQEGWLWPVNGEREVTPQRLRRLIETVRHRQVPAVFCESTVDGRAQKRVAAESGARLAGLLHVDSLTPPGGVASTYLDLMRHNVGTVRRGLAPGARAAVGRPR